MGDVLYQCEDVRDHLNELAEVRTRAAGFMGTGYNPGPRLRTWTNSPRTALPRTPNSWKSTQASSQRSSRLLAMASLFCVPSISSASLPTIATSSEQAQLG